MESRQGDVWTLRSPTPSVLDCFDPTRLGIVRVSEEGFVLDAWGLAIGPAGLKPGDSISESHFASIFHDALDGKFSPQLIGIVRCFPAVHERGKNREVLILLADAEDEEIMRRRSRQNHRAAMALGRLGKVLGMNHTIQPLSMAVAHTLYSALDLAAVLIWTKGRDSDHLSFTASAGVDLIATEQLATLQIEQLQCAASLCASQVQPLFLRRLESSPLTAEFEGKISAGRGEGIYVAPLMIGGRVFGVLELISKVGDASFPEGRDLYSTITEHLSLAINRAQTYEQAEKLAAFDPLTAIPNHRTLQQVLNTRVAECERNNAALGVVMIDVDHFRQFNEEEGHAAGDEVLRMVANVLRTHIRNYDLAARYGGEEFTLVLPGIEREDVYNMAERVRVAISNLYYEGRNGVRRQVTASFGCSVFGELRTPADLLVAADLALYKSKRAGRNRTEFFDGLLPSEPSIEAA